KIGKVHPDIEDLELEIKGRDAVTGLPRTETINSTDVYKMIRPVIENIISRVKLVLEKTPPELSADIVNHGIVLSGGGALLRGIDKAIQEEIGVPCRIADDPLLCVARGTGILLEDEELLKHVAVSYEK
ncbi:MAG: rod shape-determining protein, partial [Fervidobacterium pennivorans]